VSLCLILARNEKVEHYIRIQTHKPIALRFWVESGVNALCGWAHISLMLYLSNETPSINLTHINKWFIESVILVLHDCFVTINVKKSKWWLCYPEYPMQIAVYTISTWAKTVIENVWSLIGRTAPPDFLAKLTYLIWNHHEEVKHIDTVRAYTFGAHYFVEVDIVLPEDMPLNQAHNIGETLQEKLEQLPQVERAFVHIDFEFTHRPEHKMMLWTTICQTSN